MKCAFVRGRRVARASRVASIVAVAISMARPAWAAPEGAFHGLSVTKFCDSACVGDVIDCCAEIENDDDFNDVIRIEGAFDRFDPTGDDIRIPAAGDLPIASVEGNAAATPDGMGGFIFPAIVGPPGLIYVDMVTGLTLPGDPEPGKIVVCTEPVGEVVPVGTPAGPVTTFTVVDWVDICNSGNPSCPVGVPTTLGFATLTVDPTPVAAAAPSVPAVCANETSVTLMGGPDGMASYSWTGPDGFISSEQNPIVIPPQTPDTYEYCLTVVSNQGCENSVCTNVRVYAPPTCLINGPKTICPGAEQMYTTDVTADPNGPGIVSIEWEVEGDASFCAPPDGSSATVCAGNVCGSFRLTVLVFYEDDVACQTTCNWEVDLVDEEDPTFTVDPPDDATECGSPLPPVPAVGCTDNCDLDVTPVFVEDPPSGNCPMRVTRTWTCTDRCGNSASITQNIEIQDTTDPIVTDTPDDAVLECGDTVPSPAAVGCSDLCDLDVTPVFEEVSDGNNCPERITRTWTCTDRCNNSDSYSQNITIQDTTDPIVTDTPDDAVLECGDTVPSPAAVGCSDVCDLDVTPVFEEVSDGNNCPERITRTWTCTDRCGNSSTDTQNITIQDTTDPIVTDTPDDAVLECGDTVPSPAAVGCSDVCDLDLTPVFQQVPDGNNCPLGIVRTWTCTDRCGNSASYSQNITIEDTTDPVVTDVPDDLTIECDQPVPPAADAGCSDVCDRGLTPVFTEQPEGDNCLTTITRTWTCTDRCGNSSSDTQLITIEDTTGPAVECPTGGQILCGLPQDGQVSAQDSCDSDPSISCDAVFNPPGSGTFTPGRDGNFTITYSAPGSVTVTCTATDRCDNQGDPCSFEYSATCSGGEGCTPGYWKQSHHFDDWTDPFDPPDLFSAHFENAFPGKTLLQVLSQAASAPPGPNQLNNLGRHVVAAVLNAASPGVDYDLTAAEVIAMFNATFPGNNAAYTALKNTLAAFNEQVCNLGGPPGIDVDVSAFTDGLAPGPSDGGTPPTALAGGEAAPGVARRGPAGSGQDLSDGGTPTDDEGSQVPPQGGPGPFVNDGILGPAGPGGLIEISGDYVQTIGGLLHLRIDGPQPITGHDLLLVWGAASLDGALIVEFAGDFEPQVGDRFTVIEAGSVAGELAAVPWRLGPPKWIDLVYEPDSVAVEVLGAEPCSADATADGKVTSQDLISVVLAWDRECPEGCAQDIDGDGIVGIFDLLDVMESLGMCAVP